MDAVRAGETCEEILRAVGTAVVDGEYISRLQDAAESVTADDAIRDYVVDLGRATGAVWGLQRSAVVVPGRLQARDMAF